MWASVAHPHPRPHLECHQLLAHLRRNDRVCTSCLGVSNLRAVAVVTYANRCACDSDLRNITHQLVPVAAGGSHDEWHTVPRVQLQEMARNVSSGIHNDSGNRQQPHAPVRSHVRRLGGYSQPRRGSAPRAKGTRKSGALPHLHGLHIQHAPGGAVSAPPAWRRCTAPALCRRLRRRRAALLGLLLESTGKGQSRPVSEQVDASERAQRRTTERHRQEVEAALDGSLRCSKAHFPCNPVHHHWQRGAGSASCHGAHALSSPRSSQLARKPWCGGSARDSLPAGSSWGAASELRRHNFPVHVPSSQLCYSNSNGLRRGVNLERHIHVGSQRRPSSPTSPLCAASALRCLPAARRE